MLEAPMFNLDIWDSICDFTKLRIPLVTQGFEYESSKSINKCFIEDIDEIEELLKTFEELSYLRYL